MADKSSSQIVHQNNQPASALANNDSVHPQHDAAAQTAAPNIPADTDIDSAEAHAEPTTSNDDRENVTAEWLTQQVFFSIDPIDKAKRKSDLDQLFN